MLKKSGGLAFKPKAGRRGPTAPATTTTAATATTATTASSSQAPSRATSTAASTTGTPIADPSAGTPIPTPASISTPTPAATAPTPTPTAPEATPPGSHESEKAPIQKTRQPETQTRLEPEQQPEPESIVTSQPSDERKTPPPQPPIEPVAEPSSVSKNITAPPPLKDTPSSSTTPLVTRDHELSTPTPTRKPLPTVANASVAEGQATVEQPTSSTTISTRLPTAPPSPPPAPDTITAVAPPAPAPSDGPSTAASGPKKRAPRKRKAPAAEGESASADPSAPRKKRAPRKRQPAPSAPAGDGDAATTEGGEEAEAAARPKKKSSRSRKPPSPEDTEKQQVDHSTTKMGELIWDMGVGKPFKHADVVAERARQARQEAKLRKLEKQKRATGLLPADEQGADIEGSRAGTPAEGRVSGATAAAALGASAAMDTGGGVGYEVVDGQIVVNQNSLVVDRHAAAQQGSLETVEEDEFSHLTTAASYRRASRAPAATANSWTDEETERFYRLLGMFGCDFESIAAMFPGKNRRMIKCKFNREERLRPRRINAAVMVRGEKSVSIDIEEYKGFQRTWQSTDDIAREQERLAREQQEDLRRLRQERREAGLVDDSDNEDGGADAGGSGAGGQQEDASQNLSGMPTPMEIETDVAAAG